MRFFLTNAMIFQNISHYLQHTVAVQRERERERVSALKQPSYTIPI